MRILLDADSCPRLAKEACYKLAFRTQIELILVANRYLTVPAAPFIKVIVVEQGFDEADRQIVEMVEKDDLVITADIPLADLVIKKGGLALNPRGMLYTSENICSRLAVRDLMSQLREDGAIVSHSLAYGKKDLEQFVNQLDRIVTNAYR